MGNRAIVIFRLETDRGVEVSPATYIHWAGHLNEVLDDLETLMEDRGADLQYSTARFVGLNHVYLDGNLSLGLWNLSNEEVSAVKRHDQEVLAEMSHGDQGVIIVDIRTWKTKTFGGVFNRERKVAA